MKAKLGRDSNKSYNNQRLMVESFTPSTNENGFKVYEFVGTLVDLPLMNPDVSYDMDELVRTVVFDMSKPYDRTVFGNIINRDWWQGGSVLEKCAYIEQNHKCIYVPDTYCGVR